VATFNLVAEPWIPVLRLDGGSGCVGIREALCDAHSIERISPASPQAEVAIHRLLLAVLHRALGGPPDIARVVGIHNSQRLPRDLITAYLDTWERRFNLFDPRWPFFQVPDLADERDPWTRLLHERASGNNLTLMDHSFDDHPRPISPAEAAVALIVHQAFATGGTIKRLDVTSASAAPLASSAVFIPQGESLFHTLLLNLVPHTSGDDDKPIWERDPYRAQDLKGKDHRDVKEPLSGVASIYTWMSRAVKLRPEDGGATVLRIAYGPGVGLKPDPHLGLLDPMCARRHTSSGSTPYKLSRGRAFWRDFEAILPGDSKGWIQPAVLKHATQLLMRTNRRTTIIPLVVVGQLTTPGKAAKVIDVRREVYPLSARHMDSNTAGAIRQALKHAENVGEEIDRAAMRLAKELLSAGRSQAPPTAAENLIDSLPLRPAYWSALEREFPRFLERLTGPDRDAAMTEWERTVRHARRDAWEATVSALGATARHLKAAAVAGRALHRRETA
jgi:CRISPR system Cascade subunit CasA